MHPVRTDIDAARGARAKFLRFSTGRCELHRVVSALADPSSENTEFIEGSAVVAFNAGRASGRPFSEYVPSDPRGAEFSSARAAHQGALVERRQAMSAPQVSSIR